jgi:hypothetical protein
MWQIIRKTACVLGLLLCSFSVVYAANSRNITLIIQGSGQPAFVQGFKEALIIEAKAAGYDITETPSMAKYSIKFSVEFDQSAQRSKFVVSLVKMADSSVIVSMEYLFADEEEMLLYSQLVFFMLMANLPDNEVPGSGPVDDSWRNKWVYLSPYFGYSLMFLQLQNTGVYGGIGMENSADPAHTFAPLDNKIAPMLGVGFGIEFQFLNFMSIEPGVLLSSEQQIVSTSVMYNIQFSAKLKFPLKFIRNVVFEPYGAFVYPMRLPKNNEIFTEYPLYAYGGGIQIGVNTAKSGALFVDVSYIYYGDTKMKNPYKDVYDNPPNIPYKHFDLIFGVGYKFGFGNRKR